MGDDGPIMVPLHLRLYVNGATPRSLLVEHNLRRLCEEVGMPYELEVVDVAADPEAAERDRVMLTPTLLRISPPPMLRVAGDLSDSATALDGLGMRLWQHQPTGAAEVAAAEPAGAVEPRDPGRDGRS